MFSCRCSWTIYTDAYFVLDGKDCTVGSDKIPSKWKSKQCHTFENGWGIVVRFGATTWYSAGRVPPWLLKLYCSRRAYIYFLEICVQLVAFVVAKDLDSRVILSYIDNAPGLFALRKGFCKDVAICNVVAIAWRLIARLGWHLQLEWVASDNNVSDQVSRFDFTDMEKIDATWLDVNLDDLFSILCCRLEPGQPCPAGQTSLPSESSISQLNGGQRLAEVDSWSAQHRSNVWPSGNEMDVDVALLSHRWLRKKLPKLSAELQAVRPCSPSFAGPRRGPVWQTLQNRTVQFLELPLLCSRLRNARGGGLSNLLPRNKSASAARLNPQTAEAAPNIIALCCSNKGSPGVMRTQKLTDGSLTGNCLYAPWRSCVHRLGRYHCDCSASDPHNVGSCHGSSYIGCQCWSTLLDGSFSRVCCRFLRWKPSSEIGNSYLELVRGSHPAPACNCPIIWNPVVRSSSRSGKPGIPVRCNSWMKVGICHISLFWTS